jgi:lysophospholipase L1-like esterase
MLLHLDADAMTLEAGENADVVAEHDQNNNFTLHFKIPKGPKGDKGDKGDRGEPASTERIAPEVKAWMDANITEDPTVIIDASLGVSGAAADSKTVGDLFSKCERVTLPPSTNVFDKETVQTGYVGKNGTVYTGSSYDTYRYSVKIPVSQGDVLRFYHRTYGSTVEYSVPVVTAYDSSDEAVTDSGATSVSSYTVPSGISKVVITVGSTALPTAMAIKNDATEPTTYIEYFPGATYAVATEEFLGEELIEDIVEEAAAAVSVDTKVDKDGTDQVTTKNCVFMSKSKNLYDESTAITGLLNKSNGNVSTSYTDYKASDFIEVEAVENYTISCGVNFRLYYCWYNSSKEYISGDEVFVIGNVTLTSATGAAYAKISATAISMIDAQMQFEKGSTPSPYSSCDESHLIARYAPVYNEQFPLNLPKKIYASVGVEMNIWFENLVEGHDTDYDFDVDCTVGKHLERCYRITAVESGSYTVTITAVRKKDGSSVTKSATLIVPSVNAGSGANRKIIVLGDSTTDAGLPISKLHSNFSGDVMEITTLGTRGTSPDNHEGRSGWTFDKYMSSQNDAAGVTNAFYNPTTHKFDASYYYTNSGIAKPDYFFINLGINDMFSKETDAQAKQTIDTIIGYCDYMIASIQAAQASTKVVLCLTIPPNYSQDAFGKDYGCGQNRNRYKRNNILWVQSMIEEYEDREDEGIYLCPINVALDTKYNMTLETIPVNARNTDITYQSPIGNAGVHPNATGYWQIADVYKAFLKGNES